MKSFNQSHLLQMRGLKPKKNQHQKNATLSHLLQMRGLKQSVSDVRAIEIVVASFTDAWIETALRG